MRLGELVADIAALADGPSGSGAAAAAATAAIDVEVSDLAYDSRKVGPGTMFCCVPGLRRDGHEFAGQAIADGAVALLVQRRLGLDVDVPEVMVASVRAAMGPIAARLNGHPTRTLQVVGVTGTNGKTTSAYMVRALLQAAGVQTGLLGTVTSVIGGREQALQRTTPEAIDLQADFRAMLEGGDRACAMEVSSHALAMGRTNAIDWAAALYTNLTRDHLDYHETMEDYYLAKRRLFLPDPALENAWSGDRPPHVSVVNVGDAYGQRLAREIGEGNGNGNGNGSGNRPVTFAVEGAQSGDGNRDYEPTEPLDYQPTKPRDYQPTHYQPTKPRDYQPTDYQPTDYRDPDYEATGLCCDASGCRFKLRTPAGVRDVALPMPGRFNVENAVGALAAVHALGYDLDTLVGALERGVRVPGRFEPVLAESAAEHLPAVVVDYAHTPDSLENVLRAAREITQGRVVCVFGAGGDRDRGKRPKMGEAVAILADVAIVTSDNPRSEDPEAIIAEIVAGIRASRGRAEVHVEADRRMAIERAVALAQDEDVVVIAGKGHEQGQELAGGRKVPFDDRAVAKEVLSAHARKGPDLRGRVVRAGG